MSRLQNKCVAASTCMHALLLLVLVVAPALTKAPSTPSSNSLPTPIDLIPAPRELAENVVPPAVPAPLVEKNSEPETPPKIDPPEPVKLIEPPKPKIVEPPKTTKVKADDHSSPVIAKTPTKDGELPTSPKKRDVKPPKKDIAKKEPPKKELQKEIVKTSEPDESETPSKKPDTKKSESPKIKIADTDHLVKRTSDADKRKAAQVAAEREERAQAERDAQAAADARARGQARLNALLNGVRNNLSDSVNVETAGAGALAFASYGQQIVAFYERNWLDKPQDVTEDSIVVRVSVTLARDGSVKDAHITGPSNRASVDRSVKKTLERVRKFPPFPAGSTDEERTFSIDFNLKTSKRIG